MNEAEVLLTTVIVVGGLGIAAYLWTVWSTKHFIRKLDEKLRDIRHD